MKKFTLSFDGKETVAKSEANMWNQLRGIRDGLNPNTVGADTPHVIVTAEGGEVYKDIQFRLVKGKIQMVNLVKETCRYQQVKAAKLAAAAKDEARKAARRAADKRYRAKKHAEKIAAQEAARKAAETAEA